MYVYKVKNMACGGCVNGVKKAVLTVDPNAQVEVDLANKKVTVKSSHPSTEFVDALTTASYEARTAHSSV